jgi:hypothetical protein
MVREGGAVSDRMSVVWFVVIAFFALLVVTAANSGNGSGGALRAIENNGLTDAKLGSWAVMACGSGDVESRRFTAKRDGKTVSGIVCCGVVFKGCTVRW